jgi:hypothetical protein
MRRWLSAGQMLDGLGLAETTPLEPSWAVATPSGRHDWRLVSYNMDDVYPLLFNGSFWAAQGAQGSTNMELGRCGS